MDGSPVFGAERPASTVRTLLNKGAAGSREPGAGSREPGAGSREPGAGSREPGAGSREPGAGSREPGAGSREPEPGLYQPADGMRLARRWVRALRRRPSARPRHAPPSESRGEGRCGSAGGGAARFGPHARRGAGRRIGQQLRPAQCRQRLEPCLLRPGPGIHDRYPRGRVCAREHRGGFQRLHPSGPTSVTLHKSVAPLTPRPSRWTLPPASCPARTRSPRPRERRSMPPRPISSSCKEATRPRG